MLLSCARFVFFLNGNFRTKSITGKTNTEKEEKGNRFKLIKKPKKSDRTIAHFLSTHAHRVEKRQTEQGEPNGGVLAGKEQGKSRGRAGSDHHSAEEANFAILLRESCETIEDTL